MTVMFVESKTGLLVIGILSDDFENYDNYLSISEEKVHSSFA